MGRKKTTPAKPEPAAEVETAVEQLTAPKPGPIPATNFLSLGLTTLNLAVAGRAFGGIPKGHFIYYVGDSSSGKTWTAFQILAEAARNHNFDNYQLIYDPSENGALMDVERYFGKKAAARIRPPRGTVAIPRACQTVREFYYELDAAMDRGPVIWVEDSMDALLEEGDEEKFEAAKDKHLKGKEDDGAGSYGTGKAKVNSGNINRVIHRLQETGSILVMISQSRDKIGGMFPGQKTRSGGRALRFYAHVEIWTAPGEDIKKNVPEHGERIVGRYVRMDIQKNRITGYDGKITVPFYRSLGFDDTGACVDFLIEEGHWKKADSGSKISAPEFGMEFTREKLIQKIEDLEDGVYTLRKTCAAVWREIEEASRIVRKPRYE